MLGTTNSKLLIVFPSNNSWNLEFCYVRPIVYFLKLEEATQIRNSLPEVFCKKGVLRNFIKFAGKHLCHSLFFNKVACQSLFFNKVAGLRPAVWLKKRLWRRYFPVNFAKFLRIPFLTPPPAAASANNGNCFRTFWLGAAFQNYLWTLLK